MEITETNSLTPIEKVFIKQEPEFCEDSSCTAIKEEPDLIEFEHAWALNHLKIKTEEAYDNSNYANDTSCPYTNETSIYSCAIAQVSRIDQEAPCSQSSPTINHVWSKLGKSHFCGICNRSFSTKGNLGHHMRCHTQEKPFKCNICGRCFGFNCNLKTHYLTHTGMKPFQCKICGKCFTTKGNMSVHLRIHTGEKPFKCIVCFRSFTVKDNLQRHLKIHASLL